MNIGDSAGVYAFLLYFSMNYRDFLGEIETDNLTVSNWNYHFRFHCFEK